MENHHDLIEKYIAGELTEKELNLLHDKMESNANLKKEIDLLSTIQEAITSKQALQQKEQQLKKTLTTIDEDYFPTTSPQKAITARPITPWLVAASLLLLLIASLFIGQRNYSQEQLIARHYESISTYNRSATVNLEKLTLDKNDPTYLYHLYQLSELLYQNQQFEELKDVYTTLLANQENATYNRQEINFELIEWNHLLIEMKQGNDNTAEKLTALLQSDISKKYKERATQLQQQRSHFLYKLFN